MVLANLTIRARLLAIMALASAVSVGIAATGAWQLARVHRLTLGVVGDSLAGVRHLAAVADSVARFRISEAYHLLSNDVRRMQEAKRQMDDARALIEERIGALEGFVASKEERVLFRALQARWRSYFAEHRPMRRFSERNQDVEAAEVYRSASQDRFVALAEATDALLRVKQRKADETSGAIDRILRQSFVALGGATLVSLSVMGVTLLFVRTRISRPIGTITAALDALASGQPIRGVPGTERRDEIGTMARALDVFRAGAQALSAAHEATVAAERRAQALARHDALTGLPNRLLFREHAEQVLARARRDGGRPVAVLCLDLDGFKGVNDTLGHPAGDELLRAVARRLRDGTRGRDLVARLGGDEFAVVQADAEQPADATALAARLVEALRAPFDVQGHQVVVGTSVGIALADGTAASAADQLLRHADIALYRAKACGRGAWRFFEPAMDAEMRARRALEADLRRAVAEERLEVFYQPLVEARTGALASFEALLRWPHPERGMVPPSEFIPLAEATGLIKTLGAWTLGKACADAARWPEAVRVAVNLSPAQFADGDLAREVARALAASGLAPGRLELEITESVLMADDEATARVLHELRGLGVRIAMDDFGAGCSSLGHLRRFPFDKIKIDRSFVRNLAREKGSVEIVRAVVHLGKALGMAVVAEGVETAEQLGILRAEGCDELQGYLLGRPGPVRDAREIVARHPAPAPAGDAVALDNAPAPAAMI